MSTLFSSILSRVTTSFEEAATVATSTWGKLTTIFPVLKADEAAAVSALKQQISNAFAFADTSLAPRYADAVSMIESGADTLVMSMTHGVAAPAIELINVGMTQGFALLHAALDHAEAEAKAKWGLPLPTSAAQPTVAGVGAAVAAAAGAA